MTCGCGRQDVAYFVWQKFNSFQEKIRTAFQNDLYFGRRSVMMKNKG